MFQLSWSPIYAAKSRQGNDDYHFTLIYNMDKGCSQVFRELLIPISACGTHI
jgi:hypothetical protein